MTLHHAVGQEPIRTYYERENMLPIPALPSESSIIARMPLVIPLMFGRSFIKGPLSNALVLQALKEQHPLYAEWAEGTLTAQDENLDINSICTMTQGDLTVMPPNPENTHAIFKIKPRLHFLRSDGPDAILYTELKGQMNNMKKALREKYHIKHPTD